MGPRLLPVEFMYAIVHCVLSRINWSPTLRSSSAKRAPFTLASAVISSSSVQFVPYSLGGCHNIALAPLTFQGA